MIDTKNISKSYGGHHFKVLDAIDFKVRKGESIAIVGYSGCGKSTFLKILGLLDSPDSGEVCINNINCTALTAAEKTEYRKNHLGFIFQDSFLLGEFSALENIMIPLLIQGISKEEARKRAMQILGEFNIEDKADSFPYTLSGGEQQRVAVARAMAKRPDILFADEPTGSLDKKSTSIVANFLFNYAKLYHTTLIIVTHNTHLAQQADKIIEINSGKLYQK